MRIAIALAWLVSANLQNAASVLPIPGIRVSICGSSALVVPSGVPAKKRSDRDCGSVCHASCRRSGMLLTGDASGDGG